MTLSNRITIPVLITIALSVASLCGCKSKRVRVDWAERPIVIEGTVADWSYISKHYLMDSTTYVAVANDNSYLYLRLSTRDLREVMKIHITGIHIFFDIDGKKSEEHFVYFRGGPSRDDVKDLIQAKARRDRPDPRVMEAFGQRWRDREPEFSCMFEEMLTEKDIPLDGSEGPAVAWGVSDNEINYEFRVPLDVGEVLFFGLGYEPGQEFQLGARWGDMTVLREGLRNGGGGGPYVGPGGAGAGPPGTSFKRPKEREFRIKLLLAIPTADSTAGSTTGP